MGTKASPATGVVMVIMAIAWLVIWWFSRTSPERPEGESNDGYEYWRAMRFVAPFVSPLLFLAGSYLILS